MVLKNGRWIVSLDFADALLTPSVPEGTPALVLDQAAPAYANAAALGKSAIAAASVIGGHAVPHASISAATIPAPTLVATGAGLKINLVWDASVANAPVSFRTAIITAAQMIEQYVTNTITLNIAIGWGEIGGYAGGQSSAVPSGVSEGGTLGDRFVSYASVRQALAAAVSADDQSLLANLGTASPYGSVAIDVTGAQQKAFGQIAGDSTALDGEVGFAMEKGQVGFRSSTLNDPHIRAIINAVSKKSGVPASNIEDKLKEKINKIEEIKKYSPLLYDITAKDAASQAAFELIEHVENPNFEKFYTLTFIKLINMIQSEHKQFFPLRQTGEFMYVSRFNPILVPGTNKDLAKFNSVKTAAASSKGEFIFNTEFMQKLMDWATMENLKPNGKKYKSNGGTIPDCYAYIEFLIIHELLHYAYGDFNYGKQMPEFSHQVHNMASDFRSNYMLVKSGYNQLPIGLFSDDINADRQDRYRDMAKLVHDELKKLPKNLQNLVPKSPDEHPSSGEDGGEGGSKPDKSKPLGVGDYVKNKKTGEVGKITKVNSDGSFETEIVDQSTIKEGKTMPVWQEDEVERWTPPSQKKDGEGEGGIGQSPSNSGEGESGEVSGESTHDSAKKLPSPDDVHKEIEKKMAGRGDISGNEGTESDGETGLEDGIGRRGGGPGTEVMTILGSKNYDNKKPEKSWKALIRKMIQSFTPAVDISYAKPSRRSVTGAAIGAALGASAVKPGEKTIEEPVIKMSLVFDTSGSMFGVVQQALREAESLLKQLGKSSAAFGVTYFAGNHVSFAVDIGQNYYAPVSNITDLTKPIPKDKKEKPWRKVLTLDATGGTVFGKSLAAELANAAGNGYNIMVFTGSDILEGDNWINFRNLFLKHKRNVFLIASDEKTWRQVCVKLGQYPATFSHL